MLLRVLKLLEWIFGECLDVGYVLVFLLYVGVVVNLNILR